MLGNLLECVAPGSHNAPRPENSKDELSEAIEEVADQLYAMIAQSFLAVTDESEWESRALDTTFALLWELPRLKQRALWNRFAALRDPAVWDAYLLHSGVSREKLIELDIRDKVEEAILKREFHPYRSVLDSLDLGFAFDYQLQLVVSTYPGWRVLFYHDVGYLLTRSGPLRTTPISTEALYRFCLAQFLSLEAGTTKQISTRKHRLVMPIFWSIPTEALRPDKPELSVPGASSIRVRLVV